MQRSSVSTGQLTATDPMVYGIGLFSRLLLALGVCGILVIAGIMAYEVVARNIFDAPTSWSVEIVTYLVVATAFLPLAQVHLDGAHIRVEVLDALVSDRTRATLWTFGQWTGVFLIGMMVWQYSAYISKDYSAGTRDWGLLRTPLWIPETPVLVGLFGLLLALLGDIARSSDQGNRYSFVASVGVLVAAGLALWTLGLRPQFILSKQADIGTLTVLAATTAMAVLLSGWRAAGVWIAVTLAFAAFAFSMAGPSTLLMGIFIGIAILAYLVVGMPVSIAIGFIAFLCLYFMLPTPQLSLLADRPWRALNSYTYSAIPMFILMGSILIRSGVSASFFGAIATMLRRVPGGLAHASLASSGLFAAVSGSSIATAATIGQVAGPEMISRGYSRRLALGSIAAGGTLGILIPPSIPMIVYGATVGAPVTALFAAGIIPGAMVLVSMMAAVVLWATLDRTVAPRPAKDMAATSMRMAASSLLQITPFIGLIICVLGSIYSGIVTPTEAGALGVVASLVLSAFYRRLSVRMLIAAASEAAKLSAGILFIVVSTSILTWVMDYAQIPQSLVGAVQALELSTVVLLLMIALFYIFLGMFIDPISMMLMTVSITLPLVQLAGYNEIWFGIALMLMIEVGLITPPVGMILFVLRGLFPETPLRDIVFGALPFVGIILLNIAILAAFPQIVTFLPDLFAR